MGIRFERRDLTGLGQGDQVLLIVPEGELRVGRDRLETEDVPRASPVDNMIARAARPPDGTVRVSVFCGVAPDGAGSWGLSADLQTDEVEALANVLVRSQIHTYRRLFLSGVCMHVRIDMGSKEQLAFRRANYEVRREIERALPRLEGAARELAELDVWLLKNFVFFFAVSVDRLLESTLGDNSAAVRMRIRRAESMRDRLSRDALRELAA